MSACRGTAQCCGPVTEHINVWAQTKQHIFM